MRPQRFYPKISIGTKCEGYDSRFHGTTGFRLSTTVLDGKVGLPSKTECHPAENVAKESDAQDTGFDHGEAEVSSDRVEVFDLVAQRRGDGKCDPSDERDDRPVAS